MALPEDGEQVGSGTLRASELETVRASEQEWFAQANQGATAIERASAHCENGAVLYRRARTWEERVGRKKITRSLSVACAQVVHRCRPFALAATSCTAPDPA